LICFVFGISYPLFLNIENHCSYEQQGVMASLLKDIFQGKWNYLFYSSHKLSSTIDHLLSKPLVEEFKCLPSPEQLKYRVIIRVMMIILI
jgi:hypothetical protein